MSERRSRREYAPVQPAGERKRGRRRALAVGGLGLAVIAGYGANEVVSRFLDADQEVTAVDTEAAGVGAADDTVVDAMPLEPNTEPTDVTTQEPGEATAPSTDEDLSTYIIPAGSADMPCEPGEIINRVETDKKVVALTVDDGPSPETTPEILDALGEAGAKATFFVVSSRLETDEGQQLAARILEEGHEIADHSYSHYLYEPNKNAEDHPQSHEALGEALGEVPYAYRAPAFGYSEELKEVVEDSGQCFIGMSEFGDSEDWKHDFLPEEEMLDALKASSDTVVQNLQPGAIILTHDQTRDNDDDGGKNRRRPFAADNIEYLLDGIEAAGYEPVTVSELLNER